ncbi:MAG: TRAP transporter large permease subunit [Pseudomonadota bacterium]
MEWLEANGICFCAAAGWLDIAMVIVLCALILSGFPVAFCLAGTALLFAGIGLAMGVFDPSFIKPLPQRIHGAVMNGTLVAVPMFILMGVILEKSKIAEELLDEMAKLFGSLRGGLGISVTIVGALLAASTGIVGATVVTMGLLSLPTMMKRGYDPAFATGSIAAAGTLGQIIPPSIVLILLGDVISNAYQKAQLDQGVFAPETVSVGDLFAGALLPGLMLVTMYIGYQVLVALLQGNKAPAVDATELGPRSEVWGRALKTLPGPLLLIIAVLGSILAGIATPTEAASVGAMGALLIAGLRMSPSTAGVTGRPAIYAGVVSVAFIVVMTLNFDLRLGRVETTPLEQIGIMVVTVLIALLAWAILLSLINLRRKRTLAPVADQTVRVTTMVFSILIGAALFSLVFRGLGGEETVQHALASLPGGVAGAIIGVMIIMFILGFFLDFIEITFVVVPLVAPALLKMGVDPVWLGIMMAINLQTSFLTPPFGFALFYLRGVAPEAIKTADIYRGAIPFICIQVIALALIAAFPAIAIWLPDLLYG